MTPRRMVERSEIPLYGGFLVVCVCHDPKECRDLGVDALVDAVGIVNEDAQGNIIVVLAEDGCNYSVISHESFHATLRIAERVGVKVENSEPMAYLHQWVFTEIGRLAFRMKDEVFGHNSEIVT